MTKERGMKKFRYSLAARAAAVAMALPVMAAPVSGQDKPVVSARPGQRTARELPAPTKGGIPLSLAQAIGLALDDNRDLDITINLAEATQYSLFGTKGIYDPLLLASIRPSHTEAQATSQLQGALVNTVDSSDARASITQLAPTGGVFSLGFTGNRTNTNSTFATINPSYTANLTLSMNQPLLRNFGPKTTNWLIRIAHNTRDQSYQDFVRSVQAVVNTVEQAYWDLVYAVQNLEVKKESLAIAQELNRITKIKIDVGSLAPIEITQTEVGIAIAEQDIILAEGLIGDAQDRLKRQLGAKVATWSIPIVPTDEVRAEDIKITVDEGTMTALTRRPEMLKAEYLVDSDVIRYDYYKNQVLPALNLVGSYGNPGTNILIDDPGPPLVFHGGNFGDAF